MTEYVIPRVFFETAAQHASQSALGAKVNGSYRYLSYAEVTEKVHQMASALVDSGVAPGDRIAIMSENAPEWVVSDLGILSAGAIDVPVYPTLTHEQLEYILNDCQAKGIIVSNNTHYQKVVKIAKNVTSLRFVIYMQPVEAQDCGLETYSFDEWLSKGQNTRETHTATLQQRLNDLKAEALCSIIYTSGTTGHPKGVMLSHQNFMSNAIECSKILVEPHQKILELSFLPLSHVLERVVYYALVAVNGGTVAYVESMDTISENMLEVKPTVLASVPRIYEKIYSKVMDQVRQGSTTKQKIFRWALAVGEQYFYAKQKGQVGFVLSQQHKLADKLVFQKIREKTGGNLSTLVSGGAPLMADIGAFFAYIGLPILEGYGLTESSPVICVSRKGKVKFGTVGPPIPGVDVKIASDGEILAKGPNIMLGYYQNPEATAETIKDGWLHTGDIGELDEDGFLKITDRKKEILVMSNGKNVAPAPIEGRLKTSAYIEQVVLIGDNKKYISALIVPAYENLKLQAENLGLSVKAPEEWCKDPALQALIEKDIAQLSDGHLARYEQIKRFTLLPCEFSLERNEITPKMSLRRRNISENYANDIEAMYNVSSKVL